MEQNNQEIIKKIADFGLSDADIAKRAGTSQPTINRLRNGVSKDCMSALRKSLEVLLSELSEKEGV